MSKSTKIKIYVYDLKEFDKELLSNAIKVIEGKVKLKKLEELGGE